LDSLSDMEGKQMTERPTLLAFRLQSFGFEDANLSSGFTIARPRNVAPSAWLDFWSMVHLAQADAEAPKWLVEMGGSNE